MADVDEAPAPDSEEFLENQNTVERVAPGNTADAPAVDPHLISTDPGGGPGAPATDEERDPPRPS